MTDTPKSPPYHQTILDGEIPSNSNQNLTITIDIMAIFQRLMELEEENKRLARLYAESAFNMPDDSQ